MLPTQIVTSSVAIMYHQIMFVLHCKWKTFIQIVTFLKFLTETMARGVSRGETDITLFWSLAQEWTREVHASRHEFHMPLECQNMTADLFDMMSSKPGWQLLVDSNIHRWQVISSLVTKRTKTYLKQNLRSCSTSV